MPQLILLKRPKETIISGWNSLYCLQNRRAMLGGHSRSGDVCCHGYICNNINLLALIPSNNTGPRLGAYNELAFWTPLLLTPSSRDPGAHFSFLPY